MQDSVRRLLLEKRDILRQLADIKRAQIQSGVAQGTFGGDDLRAANLNVFAIELELAQSRRERIAILEKMVKETRISEESAVMSQKEGVSGFDSVIEARLKRLDYQIKLEEEKTKKP